MDDEGSLHVGRRPNKNHVGWTWKLGRVRLVTGEKAFRSAFARFVHHDDSGFSEAKLAHRGEECRVTEIHYDHTVTCVFDDHARFLLPFEVIETQINIMQLHLLVNPVRFGRVILLNDEHAFRQAFARFEGDPLNGFSGAKLAHRGKSCGVLRLSPERTLTCLFDNAVVLEFPWEVVEKQAEVTDFAVDPVRKGHVFLVRDHARFQAAFSRLRGNKKLGFTSSKLTRNGQKCQVTHVYVTRTFRCIFDDGAELKLPWELVARSVDVDDPSPGDGEEDDEEVADAEGKIEVEVLEESIHDEDEEARSERVSQNPDEDYGTSEVRFPHEWSPEHPNGPLDEHAEMPHDANVGEPHAEHREGAHDEHEEIPRDHPGERAAEHPGGTPDEHEEGTHDDPGEPDGKDTEGPHDESVVPDVEHPEGPPDEHEEGAHDEHVEEQHGEPPELSSDEHEEAHDEAHGEGHTESSSEEDGDVEKDHV